MANEVEIKLGTFDLDSTNGIAISDVSFRASKRIASHALAKFAGSVSPISLLQDQRVNLSGSITAANYDAIRTALDALKSEFHSTSEIKFTMDDDRYMNAIVQAYGHSPSNQAIRTLWDFNVALMVSDPFWHSETLSTDSTLTTGNPSIVIANSGNAPARVKLTVSGSLDISNDLVIENATTTEQCQFTGLISAGDDMVVNNRVGDRDLICTNDGADAIVDFEGDFLTLDPGNNTINLTTGVSGVTVQIDWRDMWY